MQHSGRDHKAHRKRDGVGADRKLGTMGMTVEDRECCHQHCRDPERRLGGERHHRAKHDGRHRDANLDAGKRYAEHAKGSRNGHHQWKHDRQQPDRGRAQERAPQSDGHHRDHMVGSEDRVHEAPHEVDGNARFRMSERRGG